jgi:hypothetical protein
VEVTSIDCVICLSKREFNKYVRIEKDDVTSSIDYISIITKLVKSDFHNTEPHPFIIGMAIKNAFNNIRKKQSSDRVIYLLKNLDEQTVENFKELVFDMFEGLDEINLISINVDDIDQDIIDLFDNYETIQF